jgi:hypothetical protein
MNFKPGDKVIFLNEKGGGVVTQVISQDVVNIAVADGFEIPYAVKDLLRAGAGAEKAAKEQEIHDENLSPLFSTPNDDTLRAFGIYIAMVPKNQEKPLESPLSFFLVNHTSYNLLFSLYLNRSGTFTGIEFGFIEPDSSLFLKDVDRNEIEEWLHSLLQVVFFKEGKTSPVPPAESTISFKPVRIYNSESFSYEALLRKKAMMVECLSLEKHLRKPAEEPITKENIKMLEQKMATPKPEELKVPEGFLDKHKVDDKIAEVDLHIGELVENYSGLSNVQMLNIQMDYFRKCMDYAQMERLSKIIFIHGVGNGTLKNEILRYLRNSEGVEYYDASYARYGTGATEVSFYRNR